MRRAPALQVLLVLLALCLSQPLAAKEDTDAAVPGFRLLVHATNPTHALPRPQVAKMFRRQIKSWHEDGFDEAVTPVDQVDESPVRIAFTAAVHRKRVASITEYWYRMIFSGRGKPPPKLEDDQAVMAYIGRNRGAIGYVGSETELIPGVKVLAITDATGAP